VRRPRGSAAQATVELALTLPVVLLLALLLVQVGLVVRDQLLVVQAARAGARASAVDPRPEVATAAARAAVPVAAARLSVSLSRPAGPPPGVRVEVRERVVTDVPIVGPLLGDVTVSASATMAVEG
jgi:Flp pilus assembly protein TadG